MHKIYHLIHVIVAAIACAMLVVQWTDAAYALGCADPMPGLSQTLAQPHAPFFVSGRLVEVPKQHWADIAVNRYYGSDGPTFIHVEYRGDGRDGVPATGDYTGALEPTVGSDAVLLELRQDEQGYFTTPCALTVAAKDQPPYEAVLGILGEGTPPTVDKSHPVPQPAIVDENDWDRWSQPFKVVGTGLCCIATLLWSQLKPE